MNLFKVTIIMPFYNAEDYVKRAIESIKSQTFENWEFYAIDDGSLDKSGEICEKYAKTDPRIHVIHKDNGGAFSARNIAIALSKGEYIFFMDADDWAEPTMLEDMVKLADDNKAQLVISGCYIDFYYSETKKITREQPSKYITYSSLEEFRKDAYLLFGQNLFSTPSSKLFSGDYIREKNIFFPKTFCSVFSFNISILHDVERVVVTSNKYYHIIRQHPELERANYISDMYKRCEQENKEILNLYKYWEISSGEIDELISSRYIEKIINYIENITNADCKLSIFEKLNQINKIIKDPKVGRSVKIVKPKSRYIEIMIFLIRMKSICLTYLGFKFISKLKLLKEKQRVCNEMNLQ